MDIILHMVAMEILILKGMEDIAVGVEMLKEMKANLAWLHTRIWFFKPNFR